KFEGKVDEGFLVGYSVNSKAFRVFNSRTRIVQETLHVNFLENKPNIAGSGPTWLFHIDSLTRTMNYQPVTVGNQTNSSAGFQDKFDAEKPGEEFNQQYEHDFDEKKPESDVILSPSSSAQSKKQDDKTKKEAKGKSHVESFTGYRDLSAEFKDCSENNSNEINDAGTIVSTVRQNTSNSTNPFSAACPSNTTTSPTLRKSSFINASQLYNDLDMPELEDITYSDDENDVGAEADFNNLETSITEEPKRAPRAWYETLANYLLENGFQRGKIDQTLFIKKLNGDILLVQIYVDDIIFGATNKDLCKSFEKLVKDKFQMSSIGELTFFLGLQVKQKKDGIFISQDNYVAEILRKFRLTEGKSASTPIDTDKHLLKDPDGKDVDVHTYKSMIGSLMYLTSSRPDVMFAVCTYTCFQVTPNAPHLHAVKRIFRYLKGKPHLGLWYLKDLPFDLVAYSDSDYAGASLDKKSTTGECQFLGCRLISWQCKKQTFVATSSTRECQFLGCRLISWQCKKQTFVATSSIEAEYVAAASCCAQVFLSGIESLKRLSHVS
nr:uncharacterized mitochondrial protein AtMg00810-like [Tanacetum cinerariifolium]